MLPNLISVIHYSRAQICPVDHRVFPPHAYCSAQHVIHLVCDEWVNTWTTKLKSEGTGILRGKYLNSSLKNEKEEQRFFFI